MREHHNASIVFIFENFGAHRLLRYFQWGDIHRRVGPFLSEKGEAEMLQHLPLPDQELAAKLQELIPGRVIGEQTRYLPQLLDRIVKHNNLFVQATRYGSIRKATAQERENIANLLSPPEHGLGRLVGGQLDISNGNSLKLLWRYSEARNPIHPQAKGLSGRDIEAENILVATLADKLGLSPETVRHGEIGSAPLLSLSALDPLTWAITYNAHPVSINAIPGTSMDWLSSPQGKLGDINVDDIAEAYLSGRRCIHRGNTLTILPALDEISPDTALRIAISNSGDLARKIANVRTQFDGATVNAVNAHLATEKFKGELKIYQAEGVLWLLELRNSGLGGVLSDEMGLGKTVQILAYIAKHHLRNVVIICPASIIPNWTSEIHRFLPNCFEIVNDFSHSAKRAIVLLSYQAAIRKHWDEDRVCDLLVLDEGQFAKNQKTITAKRLRKIAAHQRVVVTGTPIENNVDELWSHLTFANPPLIRVYNRIRRKFPGFAQSAAAAKFSVLAFHNLILRRHKSDVEKELPPITYNICYCEMGQRQRVVYERTLKVFASLVKKGIAARVNSIVLEAILRLRQACSSSSLLPKELNKECTRDSVKVVTALDFVRKTNSKTIIFCQFRGTLNEIQASLEETGILCARIDGDTVDRRTPVVQFQENPDVKVFLISFRAGGFGLNLTAAENVILVDPWWNPAAEEQAFARAHRIGQEKPVLVTKLICSSTIEEKMQTLLEAKKALAETLAEPQRLSTDDMISLIINS